MKIELLSETEVGAGYFERVERITPQDDEVSSKLRDRAGRAHVFAVRLRMGRGEFPSPDKGAHTCPSYGESIIAVWRYRS